MGVHNTLILMSDEHTRGVLGCYGNPVIKTPAIDGLAAGGTIFDAAYTNCPVCVPARATFATGRYVHQVGYWDNADPYDGTTESWHHILRRNGHRAAAIGKLHFRSHDDDYGLSETLIPMHVVQEKGDLLGLIRDTLEKRKGAWKMAGLAGPGESSYTSYDRDISSRAQIWLRDAATRSGEKPWTLFVSFVAPHFPLTAPPEFYFRYYQDCRLPMPKLYAQRAGQRHAYADEYANCFAYDEHFSGLEDVRRAIAGYYGLTSFLDANIEKVLQTLHETGLDASTRVVYVSDHGDNLGARGLWGKSTMYEEAVGIPLIVSGPGIPKAARIATPVSLVDLSASIVAWAGEQVPENWPGTPLDQLIESASPDRSVFSEYHGMGSRSAFYMVRERQFKYVHYIDHPPQLFDLLRDPEELDDLAGQPDFHAVLERMHAQLLRLCDPLATDRRAKARQAEQVLLNGGREAVVRRGDLGFSPPPGVSPDFAA